MLNHLNKQTGWFEADEITAMTKVLDELCAEGPVRGLLRHLPESEIRPAIGSVIVELQSERRLRPGELKSAAREALSAF